MDITHSASSPIDGADGSELTRLQRLAFTAVASAVVGAPVTESVCDAVNPFLRVLSPLDRRAIGALLNTLELAPLVSSRPSRFSRLPRERAEEYLQSWVDSGLAPRRRAISALRTLALLAHYGSEDAWSAVGYEGPWLGRKAIAVLPAPDLRVPPAPSTRRARPRAAVGLPAGLTRGRDLSGDLRVRVDVCVIGTGAGGAAALARLAERGITAIGVEAGGYSEAPDFNQRELDMLPHLYQAAGLRATGDQAIGIMQGTGVGGSTLHNTGLVFPPPPAILERWRREHGFALSD
jgi:hypothetical protein